MSVQLAAIDARVPAALAIAGGVLGIIGASLTWVRVEIEGMTVPGSFSSGFDGRDGKTVVVVGVIGIVAGVLLLVGRSDVWLSPALLVTGGVMTIIATVSIADASDKASRIENEFGVPAELVSSRPGLGLWVVLVAGVMLLAAGVILRVRRR